MTTPIDLTPAQWRDRAYVLDALRTRLGELVRAAGDYAIAEDHHWRDLYINEPRNRCRNAAQAVEDFVAAMHDHVMFAGRISAFEQNEARLGFIAERHDLPMADLWADPPQPNPFGACGDAIDQGEGPEC